MRKGLGFNVLRTREELEAFAGAWRELCGNDELCTPFQSPDWLLPWWRHFGEGDLRAITILQDESPIGFLPFYRYNDSQDAQRRLLLLGVGTTDYLDGVFAPSCKKSDIRSALETLCKDDDWDVLNAGQLQPHSKLLCAFQNLEYDPAMFETQSCSRMRAVPVSDLPQKIRRNAMYYRNRANRQGALKFIVEAGSKRDECFAALVRLHTERWQQHGESGVLADQRVVAWHRDALPMLERSGMLRLCSLRLNGEIIGVLYSLVDPPSRRKRTQYFYLTAFSPKYAEFRPGTLLLAMAIEHAFGEGIETVDMLRGDEDYKRIWHLEPYLTYGFSLPNSARIADLSREAEIAA